MRSCGREVGFLIAAVSLKRKMVGFFAKAMNSIPVTRPQDLATKVLLFFLISFLFFFSNLSFYLGNRCCNCRSFENYWN